MDDDDFKAMRNATIVTVMMLGMGHFAAEAIAWALRGEGLD
jgi:hypothetical protein